MLLRNVNTITECIEVDMTVMPNVLIHKYTTHEMMDVQLIMFLKWTYETRPLMINTQKN